MLKKIAEKFRKKNNNYAPLVNYDFNYQGFKLISSAMEEHYERKVIISRNQVKQLSDDFYYELYSFKNLPVRYLLLMISVVPTASISAIYCIFQEAQKDIFPIIPFILGFIAYSIFIKCHKVNEDNILKAQRERHNREFLTIDEARVYWIRNRIGYKYSFLELVETLSKWKEYKKKYNQNSKINWFSYIYDPQSKPRILALFIAFISLLTVVTMNTFELEPLSVLVAFLSLEYLLTEGAWLVVFLVLVVGLLLWQIILISHLLSRSIIYLIDYLNRDNLSDLRFGVLINFLLDYSDLNE